MILVYQLKVGLCLIAFYLVWKLLLSRETLHRFNRVLLLLVTALALVLPWVKLTLTQTSPVSDGIIDIESLLTLGVVEADQKSDISWNLVSVAYIIYISGAIAMLLWNVYNGWRLYRLLHKGKAEQLPSGDWLHVMEGDIAPFSYFRHIVINEQDMREASDQILTHEQAHIRLGHSWDVLFMDIVLLCQWWNPAAWLLRRELKQVHEYEADEAVLQRGVDARQYQLLLIRKSVGDQLFSMANNLNYQSLKKRIRMMTTKRSSRWQQLRALTVVPVAALALVAFAQPEVESMTEQMEEQAVLPSLTAAQQAPKVLTDVMAAAPLVIPGDTAKAYDQVEQMPEYPGGMSAMMKYLSSNVKYPKDAMEQKKEGRVVVQFVIEKDGSVTEAKVVKNVFPSLDEEALRVVNAMQKWTPGKEKGELVRVKFTLPIAFKMQPEKKTIPPVIVFDSLGNSNGPQPLLIVDGKEVTMAQLKAIDPDKVEAINVLKDKAAIEVYGQKGKDGVIEVKLKK